HTHTELINVCVCVCVCVCVVCSKQGFNDIGYHNPSIKTPTLDKLAAEGVTLENYYVQPICTPSRSQLLTGRYQIHTGLQHSIIRPSQPNCLPPHMDTLPERLRQAGYSTHMVGKWHLGFYRKACLPTRKGFDSFFGSLTGSVDYYSSCDGPGLCGYDLHHDEGVAWGQEGKYSTLLFTQRARRILEEANVDVLLQAVHTPLQPPKTYIYPYRDMANVARRKFAAMVSTVDEAVRNVTYALRKYGYYKNSIIIFSTDNGAQPFTGGSNWPLRGRKGTYWEGGVRGVAFVHSPLLKRRRRISKDLLHITDWFPTLVNLAGSQGLDGFDVWPTISEGKESPRQEILHNIDPLHRPPAQTMKWEPDRHPPPGPESEPQPVWDTSIQAAIRVGDWKLLTGDPGHGDWVLPSLLGRWWNLERTFSSHSRSKHQNVWLFNITADPYERQDLAHQRPDVVQQLLARLAYYNQTAVPVYFPPDDPRANPSHHSGAWVPWVEDEEEEEKYQGVYKKEKNVKKKKKKKKCRLCKLKSFFLKLNTGMMSNRI
uniref:Sulfatase N-terminal domain-containing protein n=1 Tax=Cynoglossus semilaevis TaxID=244447 RepID=A0A3P8X3L0_CYNSE